ncbi:hypothetical protein P692DRAFT_201283981 [Suillus brevipes Sb2]|nr:hypothetical protein P692DRAFT_201283981 [Suillus brevipes Sb2]
MPPVPDSAWFCFLYAVHACTFDIRPPPLILSESCMRTVVKDHSHTSELPLPSIPLRARWTSLLGHPRCSVWPFCPGLSEVVSPPPSPMSTFELLTSSTHDARFGRFAPG